MVFSTVCFLRGICICFGMMMMVINASMVVPRSSIDLDHAKSIESLLITKRQSVSIKANVSAEVMVRGWSSLQPSLDHCHDTFRKGASIDVALKAAVTVTASVKTVDQHFGKCACQDDSAQTQKPEFHQVIVKFFLSMQLVLSIGQEQYGPEWGDRFAPIFSQCSKAMTSVKKISIDLEIDITVILKQAQVDLEVFAHAGIDLAALLEVEPSSVAKISN